MLSEEKRRKELVESTMDPDQLAKLRQDELERKKHEQQKLNHFATLGRVFVSSGKKTVRSAVQHIMSYSPAPTPRRLSEIKQ